MEDNNLGVVVGYDGSAGAQVALDWAAETARREKRRLTILHTLDMSSTPMFRGIEPQALVRERESTVFGVLDEGASRARKIMGDGEVKTMGSIGSPTAELVDASKSATLVVTGSRGRNRLIGGLLGSTSYTVTAHAACPAVVVRAEDESRPAQPGPDHPVVVGIDDSETAQRAMEEGARIAELADAPLHLVTVAHPASMKSSGSSVTAVGDIESSREEEQAAEGLLASAAARMAEQHPGLTVGTELLYGDSSRALAESAVDAGLLVVGSRGRGGFVGMLLGSVSHGAIHHATCPVMVVR